jgi:hypothetical protein
MNKNILVVIFMALITLASSQVVAECMSPKYCSGGTTLEGNQAGSYICGCNDQPEPNPRLGENNNGNSRSGSERGSRTMDIDGNTGMDSVDNSSRKKKGN